MVGELQGPGLRPPPHWKLTEIPSNFAEDDVS